MNKEWHLVRREPVREGFAMETKVETDIFEAVRGLGRFGLLDLEADEKELRSVIREMARPATHLDGTPEGTWSLYLERRRGSLTTAGSLSVDLRGRRTL